MQYLRLSKHILLLVFVLLGLNAVAQPTVDFSADTTNGCGGSPLIVSFQSNTSEPGLSYFWDFGDQATGATSTSENPQYTYSQPGCYDVSLTVTFSSGDVTETKVCFVEIFNNPTPGFVPSVTEGCAPLTVTFTDTSNTNGGGAIAEYVWNTSTGDLSNDANPSFTFPNPGTVGLTMIVTNANGCLAAQQFPDFITVTEAPVVDFTVDNGFACAPPVSVTVTNTTNTQGLSDIDYTWVFFGGTPTSFNGENPPPITYNALGEFDITLYTNSPTGCRDTITRTGAVAIGGITAEYSASATDVCLGESVTFTDESLGGASQFNWDFGDGNTSNEQNPTHTYSVEGEYTVVLQVTNPDGCGDTLSRQNLITVRTTPTAVASVDNNLSCDINNPFAFSVQPIAGATYSWDFGDGNTSTAQNPTHVYGQDGVFEACLTLTSLQGCPTTVCLDSIRIRPPVANFDSDITDGCAPLEVTIRDQSESEVEPIVSWEWTFENGTPATATFADSSLVTFSNTGRNDVSLIVTTASGCADTLTRNDFIEVGEIPPIVFEADTNLVCINRDPVNFSITLPANPDTVDWEYQWDFEFEPDSGFNEMSTEQNPTHTYTDTTGYFNVALIINHNGCRDTLVQDSMVLVNPPKADFTLSDSALCTLPATLDITNNSIGPVDSWQWFFTTDAANPFDPAGLISTDSLPGPINVTTPGLYILSLVVENFTTGCSDTLSNVIGSGSPVASFAAVDQQGCRPFTPTWINNSTNAAGYFWEFSDGQTSALENPVVTFTDTGFVSVTLTVTDNFGCPSTFTQTDYIEVTGPVANYTADPLSGCPPLNVNFTDTSAPYRTDAITTWEWDFGDPGSGAANTSTAQNPSHLFNGAGEYDVTLIVTDNQGCRDSLTQTAAVNVTFPLPDFAVSDSFTCPGNPLNFTSLSTGDSLNYLWDFGDGNTSTLENPIQAYADPGVYTVKLILTDVNGCIDSISKVNFVEVEAFSAGFSGTPRSDFCPPLVTQFTDASVGTIGQYIWDFGDGITSSLQNPAHSYLQAGLYDVSLTVIHEDGCVASVLEEDYINLTGPQGQFFVTPTDVCLGDTVTLTAITDRACEITADFRDGVLLSDSADCQIGVLDTTIFKYVFTGAGTFIPAVILTDETGCPVQLELNESINVRNQPTAEFLPIDTLGCAPFTVPFRDFSRGDSIFASWDWDFGTGDTDTLDNPFYTFENVGTYTVKLVATDIFGCVDSVEHNVTVSDGGTADFTASSRFGCAPFATTFSDQSTGRPVVGYTWDFGDGNFSNDANPTHIYQQDGVYTVTLVIQDDLGCTDTLTRTNYIQLIRPEVSLAVSSNQGCNPSTITFFAVGVQSDTTISRYTFCVRDGATGATDCVVTSASVDSLAYQFTQSGNFEVTVIITDILGCEDTSQIEPVFILQQSVPDAMDILSVSVESDSSILVNFEAYPDADFVEYGIYRALSGGAYQEVGIITEQNSTLFSDQSGGLDVRNQVYCYKVLVKNSCDVFSDLATAPEHCTILTSTTAGIDQITVDWTQYVGWPVDEYELFRVSGYNQLTAVSLGIFPANVTTFTDTNTFCREPIIYRVLAREQGGNAESSFSNIAEGIPIHPAPTETVDVSVVSVVQDSSIRISWEPYNGYLPLSFYVERSTTGFSYDSLFTIPITTLSFTDQEVNVDETSYYYRVFAQDECGDQTLTGLYGRSILLEANLASTSADPELSWSPYELWPGGVLTYTIEVFDEVSGAFELVDILPGNVTEYVDNRTELDQAMYCYRIVAREAGGNESVSVSNETCIVFGPSLFVPNAFSPNGDGRNDFFTMAAPNLESGTLSIYNRWGRLLYQTFDITQGWDGNFQGRSAPEGVYVFVVDGVGEDGTRVRRSGTITLIR